MWKRIGLLIVTASLLATPALARDKIKDLSADQTQQTYKRKSMTYVGIGKVGGLTITDDAFALIEKAIRPGIELKRFDYNSVDIRSFGSLDAFVQALRQYVEKRANDRAAAEAEYEDRFKSARVYAKDVDRIMNSAYFYDIKVKGYQYRPVICYMQKKQVKTSNGKYKTVEELKCRGGTPSSHKDRAYMEVMLDLAVTFYHANLSDKTKAPYTVYESLTGRNQERFSYASPPARPRLGKNASSRQRSQANERHQRAMADYRARLPALQQKATTNGTGSLARSMTAVMSKRMKGLSEFQLKTPVTAALSDGVEFMLGKSEGLGLDDTYDVTEFDAAGTKSLIGYVKVRDIGDATGQGGGTPSYAEKVKVHRNFVGGEQLFEHPMIGANIGLHLVTEFTMKDILQGDNTEDIGLYFGAGLFMDWSLASSLNMSEFYLTLVGDFLYLGDIGGTSVSLTHWMLGVKKKWYINSLVVVAGVRGGVSYFIIDADGQDDLLGFGGDAVLGFEYYIIPEFSIYLDLVGRFFTNPLQMVTANANFEMGAQANLGVRLGF
ncbi:MAG: hypothetical protein JRF33_23765 [Deltaproteobacteria bacterium]|nr:hypothetical protein [Deltaproteobacteria bacterium]